VKQVTREKFLDMREPENRTDALAKETKYPSCTSGGAKRCSLLSRQVLRGTKTNLTESTIKRLHPKTAKGPAPSAKKIEDKLASGIADLMQQAAGPASTKAKGAGGKQQDTHEDASYTHSRPLTAIVSHHTRM
jgi:hypothetical protein